MNIKTRAVAIKMMAIIVFVSLVGLLVACNKNNQRNEVWVYVITKSDTPLHKQSIEMAEAFNKMQEEAGDKGPKVVIKNFAAVGDAEKAVSLETPMGIGPDLYYHFANEAMGYIKSGKVLRLDNEGDSSKTDKFDLKELIDRTGGTKDGAGDYSNLDNLTSSSLAEAMSQPGREGELWSLPLHESGPVQYFNKVIFDEVGLPLPTSWAELERAGKIIKKELDIPTFHASTRVELIQQLVIQSGSDYIINSGDKFKTNFDKAVLKNVLEFYQRGVAEGWIVDSMEGGVYASDLLMQGKIASYSGSNSHDTTMPPSKEDEHGQVVFEKVVAQNLQGGIVAGGHGGSLDEFITDENDEFITDENGDKIENPDYNPEAHEWAPEYNRQMIIFKSNSERERVSLKFAKYFINAQNSAIWAAANTVNSPYVDARKEQVYIDAFEKSYAMQVAQAARTYSTNIPLTILGGLKEVRDAISNAFKTILSDDEPSIDEVINNMIEDADRALGSVL
ncbi:MAG: extracellular solute-binding protein [Firmicutes bacterium]|nr:extracellular solute-binding protein [Bacillota bacterium]MCL1954024.1 extracellular solute-binding protein [Bacillota bacterium]